MTSSSFWWRLLSALAALTLLLAGACNPLDPARIGEDDDEDEASTEGATAGNTGAQTGGTTGAQTGGTTGGQTGGTTGAGGCGAVTDVGCCAGDQLRWCQDGAVNTLDCSAGTCGFSGDLGYYDCNTFGEAEPSGSYPLACP